MTAITSPDMATYGTANTSAGAQSGPSRSADAALFRVVHACEEQRRMFEERVGLDTILAGMKSEVPTSAIEQSIDTYRVVIRKNLWHYPNTEGALGNVRLFLDVWQDVHTQYYKLATEIFDKIVTYGVESLADPMLYAEVIRSETARGWVGKRSSIGPDKQIEKRADRVEELLSHHLAFEEIDHVLDIGGALPGTSVLRSAEEDMTELLSDYASVEQSPPKIAVRNRLLRDYSKYSLADLDAKVAAYRKSLATAATREPGKAADVDAILAQLPLPIRAEVTDLLAEIQTLNFLNLNLEPRFSFKSWAGLMHGLVFTAVRDLPGASTDVYRNLNTLKEKQ